MLTFWVGDRIKAKLTMPQILHNSHQANRVNAARSVTRMLTTSRRGKVLIFTSKDLSFYAKDCLYINIFAKKRDQIFGFWASQNLKLRRNTCFRGFKSTLLVYSYVAKPEMLPLSKMWTSTFFLSKGTHTTTTSGQSAWGIWI